MQLFFFIICFVYIILPTFFLTKIWRNYSVDLIKWLLWVSSTGIYIWYIYYIGMWPVIISGYYFRYVLLFAFIIAAFKSFHNIKRVFLSIKTNHIISLIVVGSICAFQVWIVFSAFMSSF